MDAIIDLNTETDTNGLNCIVKTTFNNLQLLALNGQ